MSGLVRSHSHFNVSRLLNLCIRSSFLVRGFSLKAGMVFFRDHVDEVFTFQDLNVEGSLVFRSPSFPGKILCRDEEEEVRFILFHSFLS